MNYVFFWREIPGIGLSHIVSRKANIDATDAANAVWLASYEVHGRIYDLYRIKDEEYSDDELPTIGRLFTEPANRRT